MRAWIAAAILVFQGDRVWAWNFIEAGSAGTSDGASAVLVDSAGDVISAGFLQDPEVQYLILKHSGVDGSELWRVPLSGARVLEGQDGEILVVGRSSSSSSHIVKLSAEGSLVWRVDLPGVRLNAADRNAAGVIVAVGSIETTPEDSDIFAIAVNDQGSELWRRVIGGISDSEWAGSVRVYGDGHAAVGGSLGHNLSLGFNDFAVFKLSGADGSELWRSIVPSNAGHGGNTYSVAVDGAGHVVAVGSAVILDWCDAVAVKLNGADGAEIWRTVIDEPETGSCDYLSAVAVNDEGDVFATGAPRTIYYSVFKLSGSTGAQVWRHDFQNLSDPTGGECCGGKEIAVRTDGSVVSMGIRLGPTQAGQIAVARLDPADGHELFLRTIDTEGCGDGYPAMSLSPEGDIAVAASVLRRIGGECIWPHGYDYGVFKFTGASGLDFWGGCQDERDNDNDGLVDLADPQCSGPSDATENPLGGGLACGTGPELVLLLPLSNSSAGVARGNPLRAPCARSPEHENEGSSGRSRSELVWLRPDTSRHLVEADQPAAAPPAAQEPTAWRRNGRRVVCLRRAPAPSVEPAPRRRRIDLRRSREYPAALGEMPPRVQQHVRDRVPDLAWRTEDVEVVAVGEDPPTQKKHPVHGSRES